jgi:EAL domain-containing protein (putative c-di-GMP-specific phosphodiesterase class I)/GGDEF domain-containing protein
VDLHGFRLPNETLGAAVGDELLRLSAIRIVEASGEGALVARRSADEFLVLTYESGARTDAAEPMWEVGVQRAQALADRIQARFADPFTVGEHRDVYLGASIGIAVSGAGADDAPQATTASVLLSHAQSALGDAKTIGAQGKMVFRGSDHRGKARLSMLGRLHQALDRDEFELHYQPVVNMHTRRLIGVEGLLRWRDPERELVMPGSFIGLAEDSGLIVPIGEWVVAEAARQSAHWSALGLKLEVAFNLSPRQLGSPEIVPHILAALAKQSVPAKDMVVEITESYALSDPERTLPLLHNLVDHGLRLAIDDFGTGLSSLSRLREIPAHILKIDRSFVSDISADPRGESMISVIVDLARHFGMTPHAEGVETDHERRTLLRLGCEQAQGYLFARPLTASQIEAFARGAGTINGVPLLPSADSSIAA